MRKPLFTGCGTALVTPFKNGEVDYEALDRLVNLLRARSRLSKRPRKAQGPLGEVPGACAVRVHV